MPSLPAALHVHSALCILDKVFEKLIEAMFAGKLAALAALVPAAVLATSIAGNGSAVLSNGKYEISAEGIRANFVPYGASISNLFIRDVHGIERDIVLGWDNATYYTEDKLHPHFG
jgi:aldose 1-epimerase